ERRQAQSDGVLGECDRPGTLGGTAVDLFRRLGRVPQRHDHEGDESVRVGTGPLVEVAVVPRLDRQQCELLVLAFEEHCAGEPGKGRETQRRLNPVDVHILYAGIDVVTTGKHVGVPGRVHTVFLRLVTRDRVQADVRIDPTLVVP